MWRTLFLVCLFGCAAVADDMDIGAKYIGATYLTDPLGEAIAPDTDPLIREDAFDCVTFVETVLANGDVNRLNKIRYANGTPNFIKRNHFIETDWLTNNADLVKNVSSKYAPVAIRHVTIDKKKWFKTVHNIDVEFSPQHADLKYIPYKYARNIKTDHPMVVLFVIDNPKISKKIGTDLAIRHMGFLMPDGRLRHASRFQKHVVDTNFLEHINTMVENKNNLGIILLEIKK